MHLRKPCPRLRRPLRRRGEAEARDFHLTAVAFIGAVNELVYYWSTHDRSTPLDDLCAELTRLAVAAVTGPP